MQRYRQTSILRCMTNWSHFCELPVKKCLLDEGLAERFANKEAVAEWCP